MSLRKYLEGLKKTWFKFVIINKAIGAQRFLAFA